MKVAFACLALLAASAPRDVVLAAAKDQVLDEVVVRGMQLQPHELRRMIVAAENQFYERYNELNKKDEFDVHCIVFASTGTNLKHRSCRPVFEERALQKEGREVFLIRQEIQSQIAGGGVQFLPSGGGPPASAYGEILAGRPAFQSHMRRMVQRDKALRELLYQRVMLEKVLAELKGGASDEDSDSDADPEADPSPAADPTSAPSSSPP